jgi:hypothetical protein
MYFMREWFCAGDVRCAAAYGLQKTAALSFRARIPPHPATGRLEGAGTRTAFHELRAT